MIPVISVILCILIYLALIVLISSYVFSICLKNYKFASKFEFMIFIYGLISTMTLSWLLVLMNKGFNINYYLSVDYTWLIFLFIAALIFFIVTNQISRRRYKVDMNLFESLCKAILPAINTILFSVTTVIFYFGCYYFTYITTTL